MNPPPPSGHLKPRKPITKHFETDGHSEGLYAANYAHRTIYAAHTTHLATVGHVELNKQWLEDAKYVCSIDGSYTLHQHIELCCEVVLITALPLVIIFFGATAPPAGQGLLIHEVSRSHATRHHSR
jgi:hypothetical protein